MKEHIIHFIEKSDIRNLLSPTENTKTDRNGGMRENSRSGKDGLDSVFEGYTREAYISQIYQNIISGGDPANRRPD